MSSRKRILLTSLCVLLTIIISIFCNVYLYYYHDHLPDHLPSLTQTDLSSSNEDRPEKILSNSWHPVTLPHNWGFEDIALNQHWYRFSLPENLEADNLGIYIPTVVHNVEVFINNTWIGGKSITNGELTRSAAEPQFFEFSQRLLNQKTNFLYLKVNTAIASQGLLDIVFLGERDSIYQAWRSYHTLRYKLLESITIYMLFATGVLTLFWKFRKQNAEYGLFGVAMLLWSIYNFYWLFDYNPLPLKLWEAINAYSFGATVVFLILCNHRGTHAYHPFVEKIFWVYLTAGLGLFFIPSIDLLHWLSHKVWMPITIPFGIYGTGQLIYAFYKTDKLEYFCAAFVAALVLFFGLHDILMFNNIVERTDGIFSMYITIPVGVFFSFLLMKNFFKSLTTSDNLMKTLEQRVKDKEAELIKNYDEIRQLEHRQLLTHERERIMRDMHDGIGGQLIGILTSISDKQGQTFDDIKEKIQFSINDLRLVIDSLDPNLKDLGTLLGVLRYRIENQLTSNHIKLVWDINGTPPQATLTPKQALHILRILQESVTNAIKHTKTPSLIISTENDDNNFYIKVIDNGQGFDDQTQTNGRGIKNMYYRAKQAGIGFDITSSTSGTSVILSFR